MIDLIKLHCPECGGITQFPKKNTQITYCMGSSFAYDLSKREYICEKCGSELSLGCYVK